MIVITVLHVLSGFVVLAEALNKLERTDPLERGLGHRARAVVWLKAIGWVMLAFGAGGAIVSPMLHLEGPSIQDLCVLSGFAALVVRSRLRETPPGGQKPESDDFSKTTAMFARSPASIQKTNRHLRANIEAGNDLAMDLRQKEIQ